MDSSDDEFSPSNKLIKFHRFACHKLGIDKKWSETTLFEGSYVSVPECFGNHRISLTTIVRKDDEFSPHIDVEAGFQSSKSTIAETGMGVTSRP